MIKTVLVTGVAGSGKSSVCSTLRANGYQAYDIEEISGLFEMVNKETGKVDESYDNENIESVTQSDWICNKEKLKDLIVDNAATPCFYCGTASNIDELLPLFDKVILLIASPETTRKRLSSRESKDFGSTEAVQDWVLNWKNWWEDKMKEKGAVVINTDQSIDKVVADIIKIIS